MRLNILKLGVMDYKESLDIQEKLFSLRKDESIEDTLILVEHPPVLTMGRRAEEENIVLPKETLESLGIKTYEINRGGDVTYHGPGQIVGYPIVNLKNHGKNVKKFVENMEEVFIALLDKEYNIEAYREDKKYTGVWVGESKITAIGIDVKRWITMHGFAFNVNTNLEHFKWIVPCGITDREVTSIEKLTGKKANLDELNDSVIKYFCQVYGYKPYETKLTDLI